jgi:hypothetical protein
MTLNEELVNIDTDIVNCNESGVTSLFEQQIDAARLEGMP